MNTIKKIFEDSIQVKSEIIDLGLLSVLEDMGIEIIDEDVLKNAIKLYQDREKNLNDFTADILFFFKTPTPPEELKNKYLDVESINFVKDFTDKIATLDWTDSNVNNFIKEFVKKKEVKFPAIAMPLRTIIAGTDNTPNIGSIIFILGIDNIKERISLF